MKSTLYILILFLFGIANIQAANRIKKANNFLKDFQKGKEVKINYLCSIYNGYGLMEYSDSLRHYACIDIKKRKLINNKDTFDPFFSKGGFVFQNAGYTGYHTRYSEHERIGKIVNINGETLLDSVTNWYLFRNHFLALRHAGADTIFEISLYKARRLIRKDTIHSDLDYIYSLGLLDGLIIVSFVHNKYCWINGSLYDENLNKVLADTDWGTLEMAHHNYFEIYPKNLFFYTWSGNRMTIYNKRCKKKYTIPFDKEHIDRPSILLNKKIIVFRRVYDFKGVPITPEKHYFSGYYNKFLIYNNNEETFVMTLDKTQFQQIKLGKCRLEKTEKKWLLRTPTSTDTLDNITGLNSDEHIGISVGNKLGIINKKGNTIIPPYYDEILIDKLYYIGIDKYGFPYHSYDLYDKNGKQLAKGMSEFIVDEDFFEGTYERYKPDLFRYFIFKEGENKYRYWLRNKKKSKVFYADDIDTEDLSNRFLPIMKDGVWQYLEIK
ncbi:MAG: hypothetical protein K6G31_00075 [Paludibacteraceae bacterium]|nr:hypothetical protein [Paludibacteraceae bacterium]